MKILRYFFVSDLPFKLCIRVCHFGTCYTILIISAGILIYTIVSVSLSVFLSLSLCLFLSLSMSLSLSLSHFTIVNIFLICKLFILNVTGSQKKNEAGTESQITKIISRIQKWETMKS